MKKKEIIKRLEALEAIVNPKPVLESGWYKYQNTKYLMYHNYETNSKYGFGTYHGWYDHISSIHLAHDTNEYTKATIQEVEQRLIEEAKNRGVEGNFEFIYNTLYLDQVVLMNNGKWAEAEFLEACGYVEETIKYTLENIQVDCRGLTSEQIKEMADIFYKNAIPTDFNDLGVIGSSFYLHKGDNLCFVRDYGRDKHTITYEKFMELFSEKTIEAKREPKVGDVVKAWDHDKDKFVFGTYDGREEYEGFYIVSEIYFYNIELVTEISINDFKREEN